MKGKGDKLLEKVARRKDMCRRLRRREKLLRKPLEDAGGAGADLIFVKSFTPFTFYTYTGVFSRKC